MSVKPVLSPTPTQADLLLTMARPLHLFDLSRFARSVFDKGLVCALKSLGAWKFALNTDSLNY